MDLSNISGIKNTELFKDLRDDELQKLAGKLRERIYPPHVAIVREGASGDAMFIIKNGEVEVRKKEASTGVELTVATLGKGACFGEMALLTGKTRSATVLTTQTTEVLVLEKTDFNDILEEFPPILMSLNKILAERLEDGARQRDVGIIVLSRLKLDGAVLSILPEKLIMRHDMLPVAYSNGTLTLAMVNPDNILALDEARKFMKGVAIEPVAISKADFDKFMESEYQETVRREEEIQPMAAMDDILSSIDSLQSDVLKDVSYEDNQEDEAGITNLEKEAEGAPIIRLANNIIATALKRGASDIHLEPMEKGLRLRYRIDGVLSEERMLPKKIQLPLLSRIKIISKLDITERRLPQDGRISMRMENKGVDFRISTIPTRFGEKMVARILDKGSTMLSLDALITDKKSLELVRDMIRSPYGIIFVTGPTGSGKTTTLYSALAEKNNIDVNISTVEDPIEYDLAGINQVQVNSDIGLDFARVLRAFLRQDPDIILVGETRDRETAKIAVEAALTGHLVFTTLHANDAPGTFMRLKEMGIEPFLISTSVVGIISQRLVRRICSKCKEKYVPDTTASRYLGFKEGMELYRGVGCDGCGGTGYKGRIGIYEVLKIDDEMRHLIAEGQETDVIRRAAVAKGMKSLKDYALLLLEEGSTTLDEVLRTVAVQS
ncbi:MAG: general secretion pathway protein GspE [Syntrophus sp. (in: bacteria)]|nr:general secretion pathway protein GspE [Syntrophus sp. (in: bacteria)]